jgi:hypothetical protein
MGSFLRFVFAKSRSCFSVIDSASVSRRPSDRAVQSRFFDWWPQRLEILNIEGTERRFNCGAKSRYPIAHAPPQQRNPYARADKQFGRSDRGRAAGMRFVIQLGTLRGSDPVHIFRGHFRKNVLTSHAGFEAAT